MTAQQIIIQLAATFTAACVGSCIGIYFGTRDRVRRIKKLEDERQNMDIQFHKSQLAREEAAQQLRQEQRAREIEHQQFMREHEEGAPEFNQRCADIAASLHFKHKK